MRIEIVGTAEIPTDDEKGPIPYIVADLKKLGRRLETLGCSDVGIRLTVLDPVEVEEPEEEEGEDGEDGEDEDEDQDEDE